MVDRESSVRQVAQPLDEALGREVGQEPEMAEIHSQNRDRPVGHSSGGVQDGAIASQYKRDVGRQTGEVALGTKVDVGELQARHVVHRRGDQVGRGRHVILRAIA